MKHHSCPNQPFRRASWTASGQRGEPDFQAPLVRQQNQRVSLSKTRSRRLIWTVVVQSGPGWNIAAFGSRYGGSGAITNPTSWVNYWQTRIRSESLPSCTESEMQNLRTSGCGQSGLPLFYQSHGTGVTVAADKITAVRDNASISSPN